MQAGQARDQGTTLWRHKLIFSPPLLFDLDNMTNKKTNLPHHTDILPVVQWLLRRYRHPSHLQSRTKYSAVGAANPAAVAITR